MLCLKSRLKNSRGAQEVKKKYPLFSGATEGGCLLEEGEMLFLPAGWFHEVPPNPNLHGKIVAAKSERQPLHHDGKSGKQNLKGWQAAAS